MKGRISVRLIFGEGYIRIIRKDGGFIPLGKTKNQFFDGRTENK